MRLKFEMLPEWAQEGNCVPYTSKLFFSEHVDQIIEAMRICDTCPVLEPCLQAAIENEEMQGVWGGHLFFHGKILAYKRAQGRPLKNSTFEDSRLPSSMVPVSLRKAVEEITIRSEAEAFATEAETDEPRPRRSGRNKAKPQVELI